MKSWKGKGDKPYKVYIALFVCLCTKAIHLELVSDLTTEGILAGFKRLVSCRGRVSGLRSDYGTNLKGAEKQLRLMLNLHWLMMV